MAEAHLQDERTTPADGASLDLRVPAWNRWISAAKIFLVTAVLTWFALHLVLHFSVKMRMRQRHRLVMAVTLPVALAFGARRYLAEYHRLACDEKAIWMQCGLGAVEIDPESVQGIIGAGGVNFEASETLIWKSLVLIADGRRYVISFDKLTNELAYHRLREICVHAWGVPFPGSLELPMAGPQLDPEEYVLALRHVRRFYTMHTQKSALTGLLMMGGAAATAVGLALNLPHGGARVAKLYFWLIILGFVGLLVTIRAARQIPVLLTIRRIERGLHEGI